MKRICIIIAVNDSIQSPAAGTAAAAAADTLAPLEEFRIMLQHENSLAVDTVYVAR